MRTLAFDTSSDLVSVALFDGDQVIGTVDSGPNQPKGAKAPTGPLMGGAAGSGDEMAPGFTKKRSKGGRKTSRVFPPGASVLLAPMIETLMNQAQWSFDQLGLIAFTVGPGRFTGVRVGVVTAKALAFATNCPVIGVNSLEVIAGQTAIETDSINRSIRAVLNAQREQVFSASYVSTDAWQSKSVIESQILSRTDWVDSLKPGEVVSGGGLKPILELIKSQHPDVMIAPEEYWEFDATGVGKLARHQFKLGQRDDLWAIEPIYFRPSAAEELRAKADVNSSIKSRSETQNGPG